MPTLTTQKQLHAMNYNLTGVMHENNRTSKADFRLKP